MRLYNLHTGSRHTGIRLVIVLIFFCTIVACGKKGSLYLPTEPAPESQKQTQNGVTPELTEDSEKDSEKAAKQIEQKPAQQ